MWALLPDEEYIWNQAIAFREQFRIPWDWEVYHVPETGMTFFKDPKSYRSMGNVPWTQKMLQWWNRGAV